MDQELILKLAVFKLQLEALRLEVDAALASDPADVHALTLRDVLADIALRLS